MEWEVKGFGRDAIDPRIAEEDKLNFGGAEGVEGVCGSESLSNPSPAAHVLKPS